MNSLFPQMTMMTVGSYCAYWSIPSCIARMLAASSMMIKSQGWILQADGAAMAAFNSISSLFLSTGLPEQTCGCFNWHGALRIGSSEASLTVLPLGFDRQVFIARNALITSLQHHGRVDTFWQGMSSSILLYINPFVKRFLLNTPDHLQRFNKDSAAIISRSHHDRQFRWNGFRDKSMDC